ncbi:MAG: HAD-IIIA family hydrolase [Betaproteobacteria bacterium]|nr:HAD-IIIA family hydrolase [Betaproteobacteria bacterium]
MRSQAVLFDFDGTLADTAPDLGAALNRLRADHGLPALSTEALRPHASSGARGLLHVGFDLLPEDSRFECMRDAFLAYYDQRVCVETRLFPGIEEMLAEFERRGIPWGIVTNKSTRFTPRVVAALGLEGRAGCIVCGDTTAHIKPHPAPLLHAARELRLEPGDCCYVGDDLRDVQAAHAAGMRAIVVEYGYGVAHNGGPRNWSADAIIEQPKDLIGVL